MDINPRIIAISGPLKATIFNLTNVEAAIGRDLCNDLMIDDMSVSRRHCVIKKEGEQFSIIDLKSHNGTFVNDVPINERQLKHGDNIRVGNSVLLFLIEKTESPNAINDVQLIVEALVTRSEVRLRMEDAVTKMELDLKVLIRISTTIHLIRKMEDLQRQLLESIFEVIPAQRGVILLAGDDGVEP